MTYLTNGDISTGMGMYRDDLDSCFPCLRDAVHGAADGDDVRADFGLADHAPAANWRVAQSAALTRVRSRPTSAKTPTG
jgi:hypothetical protein